MNRLSKIFKPERLSGLTSVALVLQILSSCGSDNNDISRFEEDNDISFLASIKEISRVKTRFDSAYISTSQYNTNFYIQLVTNEGEPDAFTEASIYRIPSGYEGRLAAVVSNEALNWHDITSPHTFYGWTIPWEEDYYANGVVNTKGVSIEFVDSRDTSPDEIVKNPNFNNKILETLVGCKSGPYTYTQHGKYVDLTFFHLVSKINIKNFQLTETSGAIQRNLKAEITFIGMPTTATLYPHDENNNPPHVVAGTVDLNDGITYFISNTPQTDNSDVFYICPEIDFSKIDYQIKLTDVKYASYSTYYGTFDNVVFVRNNQDFDSPNGGDTKILHAGEMMTININLIPGTGPGLAITIDKWSTDPPQESQYHTYPGIYTQSEMKELRDAFLAQRKDGTIITTDGLDELFDNYGHINEQGQKVFDLYENVDFSGDNTGNIFPVWREYILNGLGHVITLRTNQFSNVFGTHRYYNIGPVRDVYLQDEDGNNSIYIDKDGYVWIYDPEKNDYTKTDNFLPPLTGNDLSYNIDAVTGQVKPATYYNNNPGLNQ